MCACVCVRMYVCVEWRCAEAVCCERKSGAGVMCVCVSAYVCMYVCVYELSRNGCSGAGMMCVHLHVCMCVYACMCIMTDDM